jgi:hypothetical protein
MDYDAPLYPRFLVGHRAERAEFRHSDAGGRPVDASAEGDTARSERITRLQDARLADGERLPPPVAPAAALDDWLIRNPQQRLGPFGKALAEKGAEAIPKMVTQSPGRPPSGDDVMTRQGRLPAGVVRVF